MLPKIYVFLRGRGLEVVLQRAEQLPGRPPDDQHLRGPPRRSTVLFRAEHQRRPDGILNNFEDLCTATKSDRKLDARFFGHSGKVVDSQPMLQIRGCEESDIRAASLSSRTIRVSKSGVAKIKVRCKRDRRCRGRLALRGKGVTGTGKVAIPGRKSRSVRVRFSRVEVRRLRKARRLRTKGVLTIGDATAARSNITLIGPRRGRR